MERLIRFEELPTDHLRDNVVRRFVNSDNATIATFEFKKGSIVEEHEHVHEQLTYVLSGFLKITIGSQEYFLKKGNLLIIPGNTRHKFEAMEETTVLDIFTPIRQDWRSA